MASFTCGFLPCLLPYWELLCAVSAAALMPSVSGQHSAKFRNALHVPPNAKKQERVLQRDHRAANPLDISVLPHLFHNLFCKHLKEHGK